MTIDDFMRGYKDAWEARDDATFAALFAPDGVYRNTPFAEQRGDAALRDYWHRVKLQDDVHVDYRILATTPDGGLAHWRTTYRVASEELFAVWARSAGTNLVARRPGDPLPTMVLDGVLQATFDAASGRCREARIWWHAEARPAP